MGRATRFDLRSQGRRRRASSLCVTTQQLRGPSSVIREVATASFLHRLGAAYPFLFVHSILFVFFIALAGLSVLPPASLLRFAAASGTDEGEVEWLSTPASEGIDCGRYQCDIAVACHTSNDSYFSWDDGPAVCASNATSGYSFASAPTMAVVEAIRTLMMMGSGGGNTANRSAFVGGSSEGELPPPSSRAFVFSWRHGRLNGVDFSEGPDATPNAADMGFWPFPPWAAGRPETANYSLGLHYVAVSGEGIAADAAEAFKDFSGADRLSCVACERARCDAVLEGCVAANTVGIDGSYYPRCACQCKEGYFGDRCERRNVFKAVRFSFAPPPIPPSGDGGSSPPVDSRPHPLFPTVTSSLISASSPRGFEPPREATVGGIAPLGGPRGSGSGGGGGGDSGGSDDTNSTSSTSSAAYVVEYSSVCRAERMTFAEARAACAAKANELPLVDANANAGGWDIASVPSYATYRLGAEGMFASSSFFVGGYSDNSASSLVDADGNEVPMGAGKRAFQWVGGRERRVPFAIGPFGEAFSCLQTAAGAAVPPNVSVLEGCFWGANSPQAAAADGLPLAVVQRLAVQPSSSAFVSLGGVPSNPFGDAVCSAEEEALFGANESEGVAPNASWAAVPASSASARCVLCARSLCGSYGLWLKEEGGGGGERIGDEEVPIGGDEVAVLEALAAGNAEGLDGGVRRRYFPSCAATASVSMGSPSSSVSYGASERPTESATDTVSPSRVVTDSAPVSASGSGSQNTHSASQPTPTASESAQLPQSETPGPSLTVEPTSSPSLLPSPSESASASVGPPTGTVSPPDTLTPPATPSSSASHTSTATHSESLSPSVTGTVSTSPSESLSSSLSSSSSLSLSGSASPSLSSSPSFTKTLSETLSSSVSLSETVNTTVSPTIADTHTRTVTLSANTFSESIEPNKTLTAPDTPPPTATQSGPTPSYTFIATDTASAALTTTVSVTGNTDEHTATTTLSLSASASASHPVSMTPSQNLTNTVSVSLSVSPSASLPLSGTASANLTATVSLSLPITHSYSPSKNTLTLVATPSTSPSATPSFSFSRSASATRTVTLSLQQSETASRLLTATLTPTMSDNRTLTVSIAATESVSESFSASLEQTQTCRNVPPLISNNTCSLMVPTAFTAAGRGTASVDGATYFANGTIVGYVGNRRYCEALDVPYEHWGGRKGSVFSLSFQLDPFYAEIEPWRLKVPIVSSPFEALEVVAGENNTIVLTIIYRGMDTLTTPGPFTIRFDPTRLMRCPLPAPFLYTVMPLRSPRSSFGVTAETIQRIAGGVSLFMAMPAVAAQMGMLSGLQQMTRCEPSDLSEELDFLDSPLGLEAGPEWGRYQRGVFVGTLLLLAAFSAALGLFAYAKLWVARVSGPRRGKPWPPTYWQQLGTLGAPSVYILVTAFLMDSTVTAGVSLVLFADNDGDRVLGGFFALLCYGYVASIFVTTLRSRVNGSVDADVPVEDIEDPEGGGRRAYYSRATLQEIAAAQRRRMVLLDRRARRIERRRARARRLGTDYFEAYGDDADDAAIGSVGGVPRRNNSNANSNAPAANPISDAAVPLSALEDPLLIADGGPLSSLPFLEGGEDDGEGEVMGSYAPPALPTADDTSPPPLRGLGGGGNSDFDLLGLDASLPRPPRSPTGTLSFSGPRRGFAAGGNDFPDADEEMRSLAAMGTGAGIASSAANRNRHWNMRGGTNTWEGHHQGKKGTAGDGIDMAFANALAVDLINPDEDDGRWFERRAEAKLRRRRRGRARHCFRNWLTPLTGYAGDAAFFRRYGSYVKDLRRVRCFRGIELTAVCIVSSLQAAAYGDSFTCTVQLIIAMGAVFILFLVVLLMRPMSVRFEFVCTAACLGGQVVTTAIMIANMFYQEPFLEMLSLLVILFATTFALLQAAVAIGVGLYEVIDAFLRDYKEMLKRYKATFGDGKARGMLASLWGGGGAAGAASAVLHVVRSNNNNANTAASRSEAGSAASHSHSHIILDEAEWDLPLPPPPSSRTRVGDAEGGDAFAFSMDDGVHGYAVANDDGVADVVSTSGSDSSCSEGHGEAQWAALRAEVARLEREEAAYPSSDDDDDELLVLSSPPSADSLSLGIGVGGSGDELGSPHQPASPHSLDLDAFAAEDSLLFDHAYGHPRGGLSAASMVFHSPSAADWAEGPVGGGGPAAAVTAAPFTGDRRQLLAAATAAARRSLGPIGSSGGFGSVGAEMADLSALDPRARRLLASGVFGDAFASHSAAFLPGDDESGDNLYGADVDGEGGFAAAAASATDFAVGGGTTAAAMSAVLDAVERRAIALNAGLDVADADEGSRSSRLFSPSLLLRSSRSVADASRSANPSALSTTTCKSGRFSATSAATFGPSSSSAPLTASASIVTAGGGGGGAIPSARRRYEAALCEQRQRRAGRAAIRKAERRVEKLLEWRRARGLGTADVTVDRFLDEDHRERRRAAAAAVEAATGDAFGVDASGAGGAVSVADFSHLLTADETSLIGAIERAAHGDATRRAAAMAAATRHLERAAAAAAEIDAAGAEATEGEAVEDETLATRRRAPGDRRVPRRRDRDPPLLMSAHLPFSSSACNGDAWGEAIENNAAAVNGGGNIRNYLSSGDDAAFLESVLGGHGIAIEDASSTPAAPSHLSSPASPPPHAFAPFAATKPSPLGGLSTDSLPSVQRSVASPAAHRPLRQRKEEESEPPVAPPLRSGSITCSDGSGLDPLDARANENEEEEADVPVPHRRKSVGIIPSADLLRPVTAAPSIPIVRGEGSISSLDAFDDDEEGPPTRPSFV